MQHRRMAENKRMITIKCYTQKPSEPLSSRPIFALQVYHSVNVHRVRLPTHNALFTVQRVLPASSINSRPSPLIGSARVQPFLIQLPAPRVKCSGYTIRINEQVHTTPHSARLPSTNSPRRRSYSAPRHSPVNRPL